LFYSSTGFFLPAIKTASFDFGQKESTQKNWSACFYFLKKAGENFYVASLCLTLA